MHEETVYEALSAAQDLTPPDLALGALAVPAVAMPGRTKLARAWNEA